MLQLPPAQTPLNQHSLMALESWLSQLGAQKNSDDPCRWLWIRTQWSAEIYMKKEEINVLWKNKEQVSKCSLSYALTRADVEAVIIQGP